VHVHAHRHAYRQVRLLPLVEGLDRFSDKIAVCGNGRIVRTESSSMWHRPRSPLDIKSATVGEGQTPLTLSSVEDGGLDAGPGVVGALGAK
jgi:hypothetical protein